MPEQTSILQLTTEQLLQQAASSAPTPGGGSISALQGCLGASMVAMVANLTLGNSKYQQWQQEAAAVLEQAEAALAQLKQLTDEDINIFNRFMTVLKLPKDTAEAKAERALKLQQVSCKAAAVPMQIAQVACWVLKAAQELAPYGNKSAISDIGVAAYCLEAAVNGALLSVQINLASIKDEAYAAGLKAESAQLQTEAAQLRLQTVTVVEERIGSH